MTPRTAVLGMALLGLVAVPSPTAAQVHGCDYCHDLHGGGFQALNVRDLQVDLCQWCHDPDSGGPTEIDGKTIPKQGRGAAANSGFADHIGVRSTDGFQPSCWDCHNHEGEANGNLVLIQAQMPEAAGAANLPVLFNAYLGTNSFADSDTTRLDGVCEVCHTETQRHQSTPNFPSGLPANDRRHNAGADCTTCHSHDTGHQGSGSCLTCHAAGGAGTQGPNSRRAIIPEFSRASHHTDIAASGSTADTTRWEADCQVCHDQSQDHTHQDGTVVVKNADNPSLTYALTGDPQTNSTEAAKLTLFCLSCHADGQAGSDPTPFSDGGTPPIIDATAWDLSSHGSLTVANKSCFGDGAFGCHATAHGSQRTPMLGLNPGTSPASGSDPLYYQEEGFCFNCHNLSLGTGTAADSVADFFDITRAPIRWSQVATGVNSTFNLNDRHDVQYEAQQRSGWKIECRDCHDPHAATASQPWRPDPDPSDGRIPTAGASWTGSTLMSEFCVDCHDGSFRSTITTTGTTPIENIRSDWIAGAAMGGGSGNEALTPPAGGYGYVTKQTLDCLDCHATHVRGRWVNHNLFQLKDTVYSADGSTAVPSDDGTFNYRVTDVTPPGNSGAAAGQVINGWKWCNTCHYNSMSNWTTNCMDHHAHSTNRW